MGGNIMSVDNQINNTNDFAVFREPVLLINTDRSPDLPPYDQTRWCWKQICFEEDITQFNTVCSTHKGMIYETYHVDSWSDVIKEGDRHLHAYIRGEDLRITKENKSIGYLIGRLYFDGKIDEERRNLYNGKIFKRPRGLMGPMPVNTKLSNGIYVVKYKSKGIPSIWDGRTSSPCTTDCL
jgi:hypothetical protein